LSTWSVGTDEIAGIVKADVEEVFDIEVERTHNFIANGLQVSNTRWHEDDLAGRLQSRPSPLRWKVITIPAIAEEGGDVLGRQPGEELVSVRDREPGHFANIRANTSPYVWSGIYQQRPAPAEGGLFRRAAFRYWRPMPPWPGDLRERLDLEGRTVTLDDCWRFAVADLAVSTRTSADFTVIGAFCMSLDGDLILLDRVRTRVDEADHFSAGAPLLTRWRIDQLYVEHQYIAKTIVVDAQQAGYPVVPLTADADKLTRAIPAAGRVHAGRVWFPGEAKWLDEWCDELAGFPTAAHDDQVDVLAYAARVASAHWLRPADQVQEPVVRERQQGIEQAWQASTGNGHQNGGQGWDPMSIPY
jgi:predicted phage terminase large subunit-like protein